MHACVCVCVCGFTNPSALVCYFEVKFTYTLYTMASIHDRFRVASVVCEIAQVYMFSGVYKSTLFYFVFL